MSEIQVASRYAKSLIELAKEQKALDQVKDQMALFVQVCEQNDVLLAVLKNPIVNFDKKTAILEALFAGKVHAVVLAFFKIMVNKGRSAFLFATAKEFLSLYDQHKGIVKAKVVSAVALTDANMKQIAEVVKAATKGEVVLETAVDPALIGGLVLQVGDRQFDASIANKLKKLKKELA